MVLLMSIFTVFNSSRLTLFHKAVLSRVLGRSDSPAYLIFKNFYSFPPLCLFKPFPNLSWVLGSFNRPTYLIFKIFLPPPMIWILNDYLFSVESSDCILVFLTTLNFIRNYWLTILLSLMEPLSWEPFLQCMILLDQKYRIEGSMPDILHHWLKTEVNKKWAFYTWDKLICAYGFIAA